MKGKRIVSIITMMVMCLTMLVVLPEESRVSAASNSEIRAEMVKILYNGSGGKVSCDFDGYVNTSGRHEGIDFSNYKGAPIYSLIDGEVVRVSNSSSLSTLAIYDAENNKTVIYLHADISIASGTTVKKGQLVGYESTKGTSSAHTHIEVRNGKQSYASKSVNDYTLDNENPYPYWGKVIFEDTNSVPIGHIDSCSGGIGKIMASGWGVDPDDASAHTRIDIYLWNVDDRTSPVASGSVTANTYRPDVGYGDYHGFEAEIPVSVPSGTYYLGAAVIDTEGGDPCWLDGGNVTVTADTTKPTIEKVSFSHVSKDMFRVEIDTTDNVGVTDVKVPVWTPVATDGNEQDDLIWHQATKYSDTHWYCDVYVKDHGDFYGKYYADIYAYDAVKNYAVYCSTPSIGEFKFVFDPNGGTANGSTAAQSPKTNDPQLTYMHPNYNSMTWTNPKRTGYSFNGWYSAKTGGVQIYGADGKCKNEGTYWKNDAYQQWGNLTIYAQWTPNKYTITFKPTGGTCDPSSKSVTYNSTYGDLPKPTWKGHLFQGWFTAETSGTQITKDSKVTITANQTLYAQWILNSYTVTLDPNDGTDETTSIRATWSKGYGTLPELTRAGYTFLGWFTAADGGTEVTASTTVATNYDHTLYAHWSKNEIPGDVTDNGTLGVTDAVMMQKYLLNAGTMTAPARGDLTGDGAVNAFDLAVLKRKLLAQ